MCAPHASFHNGPHFHNSSFTSGGAPGEDDTGNLISSFYVNKSVNKKKACYSRVLSPHLRPTISKRNETHKKKIQASSSAKNVMTFEQNSQPAITAYLQNSRPTALTARTEILLSERTEKRINNNA